MLEKFKIWWKLWNVWEDAKEKSMGGKDLFKSWEFWFNIIAGIVQIMDTYNGWAVIPQPHGAVVQGIVNILLRTYKTDKPIETIGGVKVPGK